MDYKREMKRMRDKLRRFNRYLRNDPYLSTVPLQVRIKKWDKDAVLIEARCLSEPVTPYNSNSTQYEWVRLDAERFPFWVMVNKLVTAARLK